MLRTLNGRGACVNQSVTTGIQEIEEANAMLSVTREEVEVMLREHGQELELRIMENASRSRDEAIATAMHEAVAQSKDFDLVKTEGVQMRERLESTVTKEGQKEVLVQ